MIFLGTMWEVIQVSESAWAFMMCFTSADQQYSDVVKKHGGDNNAVADNHLLAPVTEHLQLCQRFQLDIQFVQLCVLLIMATLQSLPRCRCEPLYVEHLELLHHPIIYRVDPVRYFTTLLAHVPKVKGRRRDGDGDVVNVVPIVLQDTLVLHQNSSTLNKTSTC